MYCQQLREGRHRCPASGHFDFVWVICCLLLLAAPPAHSSVDDLDAAWAEFLNEDVEKSPVLSFPFEECFRQAAATYRLPLTLLLAVARGESDFEPQAVSHANAYGLMQIQWPGTAEHLGISEREELYDPCTNVDAGARYLRELLDLYGRNLHLALAAYNYGPARIQDNGTELPRGALWYSGYVYQHLAYVLGRKRVHIDLPRKRAYASQRKLELMRFTKACRAAAYVDALQETSPSLDFNWFRSSSESFRVVLTYAKKAELSEGLRAASFAKVPWTCGKYPRHERTNFGFTAATQTDRVSARVLRPMVRGVTRSKTVGK
jgi:hypothetical protein